MKIVINRQESIVTTPCEVPITQGQLLAALGIQADADIALVDATGTHPLSDEVSFVITFVEKKARRVRKAQP